MKIEECRYWSKLTFKSIEYHKNFDLSLPDESFITEINGKISKIRTEEHKLPDTVGEYSVSVVDFQLADLVGGNIDKLLNANGEYDPKYKILTSAIKTNNYSYSSVDRLVFIHSFILKNGYKKTGVTEEFIEFILRRFGVNKRTKIVVSPMPIQLVPFDYNLFYDDKTVQINSYDQNNKIITNLMLARDYYDMDDFTLKDTEISMYKIFAIAKRCGFERVENYDLFELNPNKLIKRMIEKKEIFKETLF